MQEALRRLVWSRAKDRCEYCGIHQLDEPFYCHHIEHIIPRKHGGATIDSNLALSCHNCNLCKGSNLTGIDMVTGDVAPLFNPRTQKWSEHFSRNGVVIVGKTPVGRASVRVMRMNAADRLRIRSREQHADQ